MVFTVVPEELATAILEGLTPFFNKYIRVVFTYDIQVTRLAKLEAAAKGGWGSRRRLSPGAASGGERRRRRHAPGLVG